MTSPVVMGHPVLNDNVRHAALALAQEGLLARFHTGLDTTTYAGLPLGPLAGELRRRVLPAEVHALTTSHPVGEVARLVATRIPTRFNPFDTQLGRLSIQARAEAIDNALARAVRRPDIGGVYAYEDGAASALEEARILGRRAIYDLPIGYWRVGREIFEEEAERRPEWRSTLNGLRDPDWKLERKDRELHAATDVVVASTFTARTLEAFPGTTARVTVTPYGTPRRATSARSTHSGAIRVIYVGSLTQRKGLADLADAMPLTDAPAELTIVGRRVGESAARDRLLDEATWVPSLPHDALLELISQHDVLVLPSLFEGFGLVLTEALSQGTPIIATDHTAAPDLLEGVDDAGSVVPIRDPPAIAGAISKYADPEYRVHSSERAFIAAERRSWATYRSQITDVVRMERS